MFNASPTFKNLIKADERLFIYSGSIVTTGGTTYTYDGSNMRSGKISRSISNDKLEIGTVYASEYDVDLELDVSRYELYNATITLTIKLDGAYDVIPMGVFTISEINQTSDRLKIKAYDAMVKFDNVSFSPNENTDSKLPYAWLSDMCTACGVTLGSTSTQIRALPNGDRKTGFADAVTDVKTWRDVLGYLGEYLGSYAYIGRDGKLYLATYGSYSADTIPSSFRYTSDLSDYKTTYDGLYAVYKESGTQEYVSNSNSGGIILDLGCNPFLQISDETNRQDALQEIIDSWNGVYYVPYESDIPMNPLYDPGDVLTFTDNQAGEYDKGAITEITLTIGGQMHVVCSGDNPRLADAQDRFTKSVEGLSSEYSNGQVSGGKSFWLLNGTNPNTVTATSNKTLVCQIDWTQSVDVQRMGFVFTCEASLSATATVKVMISIDDNPFFEYEPTEEKLMKGTRRIHASCGFRIPGKGDHSAKVYITATDNPTLWSDLV